MANFGCCLFLKGFDFTIPPLFKDIDFWFWKARMTSFIKATDFDMWKVFTNVFDFTPRKDWTKTDMKMFSLNIIAMNILYRSLTEKDFEKIKCCSSAKEIWDTLDSIYTSNNCFEVESVDSSSETICCTSMTDEQLENEEGEIIESKKHFHGPDNTKEQEEEDSQEELMEDYDQSLSRVQDAHVDNLKVSGQKGIKRMKKNPRVYHEPKRRLTSSKRTLRASIAGITEIKSIKESFSKMQHREMIQVLRKLNKLLDVDGEHWKRSYLINPSQPSKLL
ncbi:hypothetical protein K1719_038614 [Acacia pycnantha]|nr:hypothetical protein K1719_038614 [Acacia pycnantha]